MTIIIKLTMKMYNATYIFLFLYYFLLLSNKFLVLMYSHTLNAKDVLPTVVSKHVHIISINVLIDEFNCTVFDAPIPLHPLIVTHL